jgi:hypothetical protein
MRIANFFLTLVSLAGVSSLALAQRGAHHSGGVFGRPIVDPQEKMKIQATDEQRTQLRTCLELSERLRMLAAEMKKPARLSEAERAKAREQSSALLRQALQRGHESFVKNLNADQQAALKDRLRRMDKTWSELTSRFETMDRDLAEAAPDAKRLASHARELAKTLKKWQKQHRELGSEIGIES